MRIKDKKYLLAIDDLEIMSLFTSDTFKNVLQGKDTKKKLESVTKLIVSMNQAGMLCALRCGDECGDMLSRDDIINMGMKDTMKLVKSIKQEFKSVANEVKKWR